MSGLGLTGLDWVIMAVILFNLWRGFQVGFFRMIISLVGWLVALWLGIQLSAEVAPLLSSLIPQVALQRAAAFVGIVVAVLLLLFITAGLLRSLLERMKLGLLERTAGGALGAAKGLLVILVLINALGPWLGQTDGWRRSVLAVALQPYAPLAWKITRDVSRDVIDRMQTDEADEEAAAQAADRRGSTVRNPF